ncbi:MAG: PqqD family protein [Firmicutes bacterium]|nr:PqqD family protein [Bacillota bacterium]
MKLKDNFKLHKVVDQYLLVSVGPNAADFKGVITLNGTGAFLCEQLAEERTREQLVSSMCDEYDVSAECAKQDIDSFLSAMRTAGILDE